MDFQSFCPNTRFIHPFTPFPPLLTRKLAGSTINLGRSLCRTFLFLINASFLVIGLAFYQISSEPQKTKTMLNLPLTSVGGQSISSSTCNMTAQVIHFLYIHPKTFSATVLTLFFF